MKSNKKVDLYHCSLQSEMILHKCWTASKYKLPHLSGKPVFCETQPAHYNTARTSCSWDRCILCVVPPYQPARTWKPSRVLGWAVFFLSRAGTLKCAVSHLDKHWSQLLLYPCSRLCFALSKTWWGDPFTTTSTAPCLHTGMYAMWPKPKFTGSWKTAAWKWGSKTQDSN